MEKESQSPNTGGTAIPTVGQYAIIDEQSGILHIAHGKIVNDHHDLHIIDTLFIDDNGDLVITSRQLTKVAIDYKFSELKGEDVMKWRGKEISFKEFIDMIENPDHKVFTQKEKAGFWRWLFNKQIPEYKYINNEGGRWDTVKCRMKEEYWNKREYRANNYLFVKY